MKRILPAAILLLLAGIPALAHRLDEYLQATILSVEKGRVQAQMTLTPGVAVFSKVIAGIDTDGDGILSEAEQRAYAERVLGDLRLAIDGHHLTPRLISVEFPATQEMEEGRGEIILEFDAALPGLGSGRKLTFENHHLSAISAYQVNCLVPRDPDIRIVAQNRDYLQSRYELDYAQSGGRPAGLSFAWSDTRGWLAAVALPLIGWIALLWRQRVRNRLA
jgi:hypothetical protein